MVSPSGSTPPSRPCSPKVLIDRARTRQGFFVITLRSKPPSWLPASSTRFCVRIFMQGLLNFRHSIQQNNAFFAPAGDARISAVDVRDLADVAVAALTTSQLDNKICSLTGPAALTFAEMAHQLSRALGRTIAFVDVPRESIRAALTDLGFPAWQADGLLEEFAMYRRGEAAEVESGVGEALGRPPRSFDEFARDYATAFA